MINSGTMIFTGLLVLVYKNHHTYGVKDNFYYKQ